MPLKQVDWDNFQFRCHYFGELMTKTKGKTNLEKFHEADAKLEEFQDKLFEADLAGKKPTATQLKKMGELENQVEYLRQLKNEVKLSDTCKRRLVQIYTEETTGRVKDIESMYLEKGILTEEDSITLYSLRTGTMYRKNKERVSNGFVTGEIDLDDEKNDMTIDTKGSWDIFTFDANIARAMGKNYWWQGQMYMWIKNRSRHRVSYCLNNTPKEIYNRLEKNIRYKFGGCEDDLKEALEKLRLNHNFDDLPLERKIRIYEIERDEDAIEEAKRMIPHFRHYLKNITNSKLEEDEI